MRMEETFLSGCGEHYPKAAFFVRLGAFVGHVRQCRDSRSERLT